METLPLIPIPEPRKCASCGKPIIGRRSDARYCCNTCMHRARKYRYQRKRGTPLDKVKRECPICGAEFVSRRWNQIYCSKPCLRHVINGRRIKNQRKTNEEARVSPQLIARRAAVIRAKRPRPLASFPAIA